MIQKQGETFALLAKELRQVNMLLHILRLRLHQFLCLLPHNPNLYPAQSYSEPETATAATSLAPTEDTITVAHEDISEVDQEDISSAPTAAQNDISEASAPPEHSYGLRSKRFRSGPSPYALSAMLAHLVLAALVQTEVYEPRSWKEAHKTPQWPQWRAAMEEEHLSLLQNNTWDIVALPVGKHALTGKWVYKVKQGSNGEVLRYKARWVVRGFLQMAGIDYRETFAAVVKPMSYKIIFAIAAALDLELHQMDVKTVPPGAPEGLAVLPVFGKEPGELPIQNGDDCGVTDQNVSRV